MLAETSQNNHTRRNMLNSNLEPTFQGTLLETPEKWAKVRAAKDREARRAALGNMDLALRLEPLFAAAIADHAALLAIEQAGEGQQAIIAETNRKLKLLDSFPPKNQQEAEKLEVQRKELQQVLRTGGDLLLAADGAKNPREGLEKYFWELFDQPPLPHSGPLSSWSPPTTTMAAANKLNVSVWRAGDWRKIKPEPADPEEEQRRQRYRSF
jgi:hypothetical protein